MRGQSLAVQQVAEAADCRLWLKAETLDRIDGSEATPDPRKCKYCLAIMQRRIGEDDLASGQAAQHGLEPAFEDQHALEIRELVGVPEKVSGIGTVMPHQAEQGGSVALPVVLTNACRLVLVHAEVISDVLDHRTVDVREDMWAGVVQCVVEIKQPNPWREFLHHLPVNAT